MIISRLIVAALLLCLISCNKEPGSENFKIEGISTENYPKVDGSTSTEPLQRLIACKLLNCGYYWRQRLEANGTWELSPDYNDIPYTFFNERIKTSQTHNSIINLIDKNADFILSARRMSDDEKAYAEGKEITLIETPIALDAFIFIVNTQNPVLNLTLKQVQDIYTGEITNWSIVKGKNAEIKPFTRNQNSGSQELMESLVMKGLEMSAWPESVLSSMTLAFSEVNADADAICYTVYYYKTQIVRENMPVKTLAINGIYPKRSTISGKKYPLIAEVYAVIRTELDHASMAYKLYELLQTEEGKRVISESGYIPE